MNSKNGKYTVMVVDDDIDFLTQMKINLHDAGFSVTTAEGQQEAENILELSLIHI